MALTNHIVPDSPTNNFCTLNPLSRYLQNNSSVTTLSDGNVKISFGSGSNVNNTVFSSIPFLSGKIYCEYLDLSSSPSSNSQGMIIGIHELENLGDSGEPNSFAISTGSARQLWSNGSNTNYWWTGTPAQNDIYSFFVDLDSSSPQIKFYRNNSLLGSSVTITTDKTYVFSIMNYGWQSTPNGVYNFGQDPTFAGNTSPSTTYTDASGIGAFYYPPPTGALALCTANLPDFTPDVDDDVPQDYFKAVTYTGNGTSQSITGVGFQPDLVWSKPRSSGFNIVRDSVRGSTYRLITDNTYAELSGSNYGTFSSNGFNLGSEGNVNSNNVNYIAWCWKSGGPPDLTSSPTKPFAKNGVQYETLSAANITAGTITPTAMSVNTDAGFSIVKYVGVFANRTIPHGLNSVPEMIIVKNLDDSRDWVVYQHEMSSDPKTDHLHLNLTEAVDDYPFWNDTAPTSTFFSIGAYSAVNRDGDSIIAYCWHSVEGYSKFGSYTGNGSTDGPFVYCGFRPAFVMIKCSSDTTTTHTSWAMYDNARDSSNVMNKVLYANKSINEGYRGDASTAATDIYIDFLSNGFKVRSTKEEVNDDGETYIFMAFAEQPFKYANAR